MDGMAKRHVDKPAPKKVLTVENAAEQIERLRGNLAAVARHFGIRRQSVSHFVSDHPELRPVVAAARETRLDRAEDALDRAVGRGEGWAVCFTLKTLGKDRGYVERLQVEDVTDDDVNRAIDAELARLAARRSAAHAGATQGANGTH
jgi:hypothetical protein